MNSELTAPPAAVARAVSVGAGMLAVLVGGGHLLAWKTGLMARVPADVLVMKTNAALGVLVAGIGLVFGRSPRLARICAVFLCRRTARTGWPF